VNQEQWREIDEVMQTIKNWHVILNRLILRKQNPHRNMVHFVACQLKKLNLS